MTAETVFAEDDIRRADPKFRSPHFSRYLRAVERLDLIAQKRHCKRVLHLAVRWLLDQPGVGIALWGARRPRQLDPIVDVFGWSIDWETRREIDEALSQ